MSSSYLNFYEMAHIPCPQGNSQHEAAELGLAAVNVDGKAYRAGISVNGQCLSGGVTVNGTYMSPSQQWPGNYSVFFANNTKYAVGGWATANNNNAIKQSRMSFGL